MHPCPGNWVAIGPTVVYLMHGAANEFNVGVGIVDYNALSAMEITN